MIFLWQGPLRKSISGIWNKCCADYKKMASAWNETSAHFYGTQWSAWATGWMLKAYELLQRGWLQLRKPQCHRTSRSSGPSSASYHKFLPNLATIVQSLNDLLQKNQRWHWSVKCTEAVCNAKQLLTTSNLLMYYDPTLPLRLAANTSQYGIWAVISHVMPNGVEKPITFTSQSLTASEKNYSQIHKKKLLHWFRSFIHTSTAKSSCLWLTINPWQVSWDQIKKSLQLPLPDCKDGLYSSPPTSTRSSFGLQQHTTINADAL